MTTQSRIECRRKQLASNAIETVILINIEASKWWMRRAEDPAPWCGLGEAYMANCNIKLTPNLKDQKLDEVALKDYRRLVITSRRLSRRQNT